MQNTGIIVLRVRYIDPDIKSVASLNLSRNQTKPDAANHISSTIGMLSQVPGATESSVNAIFHLQ